MIVMGIIALMIPAIFTMVFAVVRQEAKVYALNTAKSQGDLVLNNMKFNIRNYALTVHSAYPATDLNRICNTSSSTPTAQNPLVLRDREGNSFYYSVTSGAIASNSSKLASPASLTNSKVQINNLSFSCNTPSQFSSPIITVSYTVDYVSAAGQASASLPYQTKIKLRNR